MIFLIFGFIFAIIFLIFALWTLASSNKLKDDEE